MNILLCTDGSAWTNRALEMGIQIALATASQVDVLAVAHRDEQLEEVGQAAEAAIAALKEQNVPVAIRRCVGRMDEEAIRQAHVAPYDLVVIGSRGRRGIRRLLFGSMAAHVVEHSPTSVLIVKGRRRKMNRFLVCTAAGPASGRTVQFSGRLARAVNASVTLIHVMSQVPLSEDALVDDLGAAANELIERRTREGLHLNKMVDLLVAEGTKARAVVRHGLVVDEIAAEVEEGQFGLLVVGAHTTPGINRSFVGDLAEQTLLAVDIPVLVVNQGEREA
jgi:nucleotide-binding universal stress UspA family protein